MDIHVHEHHASISDAMRKRAERLVVKAAERIPRVVSATIHFEQDGAVRRVTIAMHAPRHHDLMGRAEGRYFGPALVTALARVKSQASKEKRGLGKGRAKVRARSRARADR